MTNPRAHRRRSSGTVVGIALRRVVPVCATGLGLAVCCVPVLGQCEEAMLRPEDVAEGDRFGNSVAIAGETIVVGSVLDDDRGVDAGSAYVFRFDGSVWVETAKLLASDGTSGDLFGVDVAVVDDVIVVGSIHDDNEKGEEAGSAYVFRFDGIVWVEEAKLLASDGSSFDWFGHGVAVSGDVAVIGARLRADGIGAVYVFRHDGTTWLEDQILTAPGGSTNDNFGLDVAIEDSVLIAGRAKFNVGPPGSAHVFRYDGASWGHEAELQAPDGVNNNWFGQSVALSGTTVLVGAQYQVEGGTAYVFRFDGTGWQEEARLFPTDPNPGDEFGVAVAVADDTILVGAGGHSSTSAYLFRRVSQEWIGSPLALSDGQTSGFGQVAVVSDRGVVGTAAFKSSSGAAYVFDRFEIPRCECVADITDDGRVGLEDLLVVLALWGCEGVCLGADLNGNGVVDFADLRIVLREWGPCV